jgi:hypothetical protein
VREKEKEMFKTVDKSIDIIWSPTLENEFCTYGSELSIYKLKSNANDAGSLLNTI